MMLVQDGDFNSKFFHTCALIQHHKKHITHIVDENGFTQTASIENCFMSFYKHLWASKTCFSLFDILSAIPMI